eukprot:GFUD01021957.1.p1 GENE.GFUD01021957.1~~GFUD01021957.1.p1  ORF type:complete len:376 (+),score=81.03 GFUD01021957.1:122-1249(+)
MEMPSGPDVLPWYVEWAWIGGYSSLSTLVLIFNLLIIFSVAKNKFLHYSFHYVVVALAFRNQLRVWLALCLLFLAKLIETPQLLEHTYLLPVNTTTEDIDLTQAANMPMTCKILSMSDHLLMTTLMFYLAALSVYMFCRHPNPPFSAASETTLKLHGIAPVKERFWVSPLLIIFPPLLSTLLCLPVPLMPEIHPMIALPGGSLCNIHDGIKFSTYQFSIAIIGFYLPAAIVIFLMIGLSIRRCISCSGGPCVSSFCKEEIVLAFLTLPYIPAYLAMYLPLLDNYLQKLNAPQTNLQQYLTPEIARAAEMGIGLMLPIVVFTMLQGYRKFSSKPDGSDIRMSRKDMNNHQPTAPDNRLSQASFDLDLSHRNSYYQQ